MNRKDSYIQKDKLQKKLITATLEQTLGIVEIHQKYNTTCTDYTVLEKAIRNIPTQRFDSTNMDGIGYWLFVNIPEQTDEIVILDRWYPWGDKRHAYPYQFTMPTILGQDGKTPDYREQDLFQFLVPNVYFFAWSGKTPENPTHYWLRQAQECLAKNGWRQNHQSPRNRVYVNNIPGKVEWHPMKGAEGVRGHIPNLAEALRNEILKWRRRKNVKPR